MFLEVGLGADDRPSGGVRRQNALVTVGINIEVGHQRRYRRPELREKLGRAGFEISVLKYRNLVGTAGWFFFYAIFALAIRRNDAFNTVTSIFYFVFLFASSMFYPIDPLPVAFRAVALVNPITWHVDVMRFATIGLGDPRSVALEAAGFVAFTLVSFAGALLVLRREG